VPPTEERNEENEKNRKAKRKKRFLAAVLALKWLNEIYT
jgi:hypothetical protein